MDEKRLAAWREESKRLAEQEAKSDPPLTERQRSALQALLYPRKARPKHRA